MAGDGAGAGDDSGGGVTDDLGVAVGPAGDVGEGVRGGVDAEGVGDEVGDGFGFDFFASAAGAVGVAFVE